MKKIIFKIGVSAGILLALGILHSCEKEESHLGGSNAACTLIGENISRLADTGFLTYSHNSTGMRSNEHYVEKNFDENTMIFDHRNGELYSITETPQGYFNRRYHFFYEGGKITEARETGDQNSGREKNINKSWRFHYEGNKLKSWEEWSGLFQKKLEHYHISYDGSNVSEIEYESDKSIRTYTYTSFISPYHGMHYDEKVAFLIVKGNYNKVNYLSTNFVKKITIDNRLVEPFQDIQGNDKNYVSSYFYKYNQLNKYDFIYKCQ